MKGWIAQSFPRQQLGALEFLVGEFTSLLTLFPEDRLLPARFRSVVQGYREACDRFLRTEQFSEVPGLGLVSSTSLYGYSRPAGRYECYSFSSGYEQPLILTGDWQGDQLVLVSEPVEGARGLERFRHTLSPAGEDRWRFLEERWEPEGYVKQLAGTYLLGAPQLVP